MLFHLIELLTEQSGDDRSYFLLIFRASEWAERTINCSVRPTNIPSVAGKDRHFDWDVNVVKVKLEQEGANKWERAPTLRTTRTLTGLYHTLWETFQRSVTSWASASFVPLDRAATMALRFPNKMFTVRERRSDIP